ncbi:MAG: hypothetical protein E7426_00530, partial [Ruminococcaceae bacterium]|nr:hypothetical protein [Oscillospiraceae bacterium]
MRYLRRAAAALLALVMALSLAGGVRTADAAETGVSLTCERTGDTVTAALVADRELNLGGLSGTFAYDEEAFEFVSCDSGILSVMCNPDTRKFIADCADDLHVPAGTQLLCFTYRTAAGFSEDEAYPLTVDLDVIYDFDLTDYAWSKGLSVTAQVGSAALPAGGAESASLTVGVDSGTREFSPFYPSDFTMGQWVTGLTQIPLLTTDRMGAVVFHAAGGETVTYGGEPYTYYGPADLTVTDNGDGSVTCDFTLRQDLTFSDGVPVTADDVIFSMYVLADPAYDGGSGFCNAPIRGLSEYRTGMDPLRNLLVRAGRDNTDFTYWTADVQTAFWTEYDAAAAALAQEIVDYCVANYDAADVASAAGMWGYSLDEGADIEDFAAALEEAYGDQIADLFKVESVGSGLYDLFPTYDDYGTLITHGTSAAGISGIRKTGDYGVQVVLEDPQPADLLGLQICIAPLHYYGDTAKYDYDSDRFGFDKGDLSGVQAKNAAPLGAGAYRFVSADGASAVLAANSGYYRGAPKISGITLTAGSWSAGDIVTGTIDLYEAPMYGTAMDDVRAANSNGELSGDRIITRLIDNTGYGYVGINADRVSVGGEPGSAASKNLRKGIATVLAAYRQEGIDSYYGGRAKVIDYPDVSWAAPRPGDSSYEAAFSTDVNGAPIYTDGMTDAQRHDAALAAARGFFEAAGYTVEDGRLTAAPEGASLRYEVLIPGGGDGDHPIYGFSTEAAAALETIGLTLAVNDLTGSAQLWEALDTQQAQLWAAAFGAVQDPDLYQIYYSGVGGGNAPGGSQYMFSIADAELDQKILEARSVFDTGERKALYGRCLDIIRDWAVMLPAYQRIGGGLCFSAERLAEDTLPAAGPFWTWVDEIERLEMADGSTGAAAPEITAEPVSVTVNEGKTATFTVSARGDNLTYQWYYRTSSTGTWTAVSAASGKTASYSLTAAARHNGYQYRCLVKNAAGHVYTGIRTLTVVAKPVITTQPKNATVNEGKTAKFTVAATGDNLTYQWYYRTSSTGTWTAVSAASGKTASYSLTAAARH